MRARGGVLAAVCLLAAAPAPPWPARAAEAPCPLPPCRADASEFPPQEADCGWTPPVPSPPALPGCGAEVRVDAAHRNIYQVAKLYWPFAKLLASDGFEVRDSPEPFDELLAGRNPRILVVAGADEVPSAAEVRAVVEWVESRGGGLLVILDHFPHDQMLALLRGFLPEITAKEPSYGGLAVAPGETAPSTVFLAPGSLGRDEHRGDLDVRSELARGVARVETYGGSALLPCPDFRPSEPGSCAPRPPAESPLRSLDPVLVFPPGARSEDGQDLSGHLQGFGFEYGAGRVYVSGEGAMFTAQRQYYLEPPPAGYGIWGMQESDNDNARLLGNVVRWLAGLRIATPGGVGRDAWTHSGAASRSSAWSSWWWVCCSG